MKARSGEPERRAALQALLTVFRNRNRLPADWAPIFRHLNSRQTARARRLADSVLRHHNALTAAVSAHLDRDPPLEIALILKMMAAELLIDGTPAHAAVHSGVGLARDVNRSGGLRKLVNAIGRKLADERERRAAQDPDSTDASTLLPNALPGSLRAELQDRFGNSVVTAIEATHAKRPPIDLTLRDPGRIRDWSQQLGAAILPTGSLRLFFPGQITALPGYDDGDWWVQNAAAAVPVHWLGPVHGSRVLDLCAAPGGKSMQLAAAGAVVTALDRSRTRMRRLRANLRRTGLESETIIADALTWEPNTPFDAVLLDAPCTATGTIRRHPEIPFIHDLSPTGIRDLIDLQDRLLDRAAAWVRPGGLLLFATCSLIAAEGEDQLAAFLSRHSNWVLEAPDPGIDGIPETWSPACGILRIRPDHWQDRGGVDGFFIARCRRHS